LSAATNRLKTGKVWRLERGLESDWGSNKSATPLGATGSPLGPLGQRLKSCFPLQGSSTGSSSGNHGGSGGGNGHKPGCENPGNEARGTGGSGIQDSRGERVSSNTREVSKEGNHLLGGSGDNDPGQGSSWGSRGGDAVGGVNTVNSETSPGMFNFDTFWKNFKSKLGFINWDAISKNKVPPPSTRALLYFSRLWEDFKHNTPFLNWKAIIEPRANLSLQLLQITAPPSSTLWGMASVCRD
uniref:Dermokine n=1 Tax=Macaca mulatta TaxID=9544 RepID=A0A1D5RHL5_MACMU